MQGRSKTEITDAKAVITRLLGEAIAFHEHHEEARQSVEADQQAALDWAWKSGKVLNQIKPLVGHTNWTPWLASNWISKKLKRSVRSAQSYMKIDSDNPNALRVADLKFDTIRKYRIGFVPDKVKPALNGKDESGSIGNISFERPTCELKFVNEWHRWKRRRDLGLVTKNIEEERRNCRELYDWMKAELYLET